MVAATGGDGLIILGGYLRHLLRSGLVGMHITDYLHEKRVPFEPLAHAPAFTAQRLAKYLRVPGKRVAKCVMLRGGGSYLVAVLPATCHVDTERLGGTLHAPVRIADDREIAAVFSDCEWGVVPAFGAVYGLVTLLEATFPADALVVLPGNTRVESVRLRCSEFERLEKPRRLHFARDNDNPPRPAPLRDVS
jgi:Ala-tRNA(Pro) deacylase